MARDLTLEPPLPVNEIQGDILIGLPKRREHLIFFEIVDAVKFKAFLKTLDITSVQECLDKRQAIADNKAKVIVQPYLEPYLGGDSFEAVRIGGFDKRCGV